MREFASAFALDEVVIDCTRPWRESELCLACLHADGRLELLSGAWARVLDYRQDELQGRSFYGLLDPDDARARERLHALLDRRRADPVRLEVLRKGGGRRTLQVYRLFDEYEPSLYLACDPFQAPEMSRIISSMSARSSP
jgi:PAS domain-containing protein